MKMVIVLNNGIQSEKVKWYILYFLIIYLNEMNYFIKNLSYLY
jgi:hypothetical protein